MKLSTRTLAIIILLSTHVLNVWSLPEELTINQKDSDQIRLQKEATGEYLIHEMDNNALDALERMIKKHKGQENEADFLMRKAELFIKRTQSAKFFEMNLTTENEKAISFIPVQIKEQKSKNYLKQANTIYADIIKRYPKFNLVDQALYRMAFNYEQLGESQLAYKTYLQLVNQYPSSTLTPDAHLAMGEIFYQQNKFEEAILAYEKVRPYKKSRAYWYAEYKRAWSLYNLKQSSSALDQIITVIESSLKEQDRLTLLQEAIKDSTLFYAESREYETAYSFYKKLLNEPNLYYPPLIQLGNIYIRYGKISAYRELSNQIIKNNKNADHHQKILTQRFNFELDQKDYSSAFDYAKSIQEECTKNIDCKSISQSNFNLLIKYIWKDHKKDSTKKFSVLLEQILIASFKIEPNPLLADFYFEQKKFLEAAKYYYQIYQLQKSEKALLAAIDSLLQQKDKEKALLYQIEFVEQFPKSEHSINQSMQIALFYLTKKQAKTATPYLDSLRLKKKELKGENYDTYADLELDYLNQIGKYHELIKQADIHAKTTNSLNQKEEYLKIKSQSQTKILVESIKNEKSLKDKEILLQQLRSQLNDEDFRATKDQKLDLYLFGLSHAAEHKLLKQSWLITKDYFTLTSPTANTLDIAKKQLSIALSEGYLDESLDFSVYIAAHPLEMDKASYIKNCLNLLKVTGKDKEFISFAEQNILPNKFADHSDLVQKLWENNESNPTSLVSKWAIKKINQFQLEPTYSLLEVKKLEQLLAKKRYSDVFDKSKKWFQTQYSKEIRAEARWLQAQVLEKELYELSAKVQRDRIDLVVGIKTERFEKAQKAYQEAINLAKVGSKRSLDSLAGMERINRHFIDFTKSIANNHERNDLAELSKLLEKELVSREKKENPNISIAYEIDWSLLTKSSTLYPTLDQSILEAFPAIESSSIKFNQALGAFHRSEVAFREGNYELALFLNDIGLSFNKDHPQLFYQRGRIFAAQKKYSEALAVWKLSMVDFMPSSSQSTLHFLLGYYEGNCYKSLGFLTDIPNSKSLKKMTTPFAALCFANTQQIGKAYQILEESNLSPDWKNTYQATIAEANENNLIKSSQFYKKAQGLSNDLALKSWLKDKLAWISTQAEHLKTDKRLSEEQNL